ncbi:transporter [Niastella koreensis]|uniref:Outer membrane efflux protein n=2 Tax=Niastella koreensis TaxID=354356 RepID=G8TJZ4_NIAKG|nr:TolC family protein [Niastella koreensis]AEW02932.1 outer membrane efflux protein [Niastella koreensis GR20-10]OQP55249.1 transporter [Niastella koreensis]
MLKYFLLIAGLLPGLFTPLLAQDTTAGPLKWDLQTCLDYAKKNNITINNLRWGARSSEQDLLQARAAKLPSVSATLTQSLVNSNNANPVVGGFQTQATASGNYGVTSNWVVYNGGFLNNDIRQKTILLESAQLNVQAAQNDITLQITQAYLNILLQKENIAYLQELVTSSESQLTLGKQRFDAGSLSRKDYLQLEATLANDKYNLTTAINAHRTDLVNLKQILQLPSSVTFDVIQPDTLVTNQVVTSLPEAENAAVNSRPEVKVGELNVKSAEVGLEKSRAGRLPVISLGAGLSSGYSDNNDLKYFNQVNNNFYQRIGATVSIPIFANRVNKSNIERSKIQIEQAKLSLQGTKTTLDQAVEQAYIAVLNSQAQLEAAESSWKTNQESFHITNEQMRLGAFNTIDLLTQKNLYVQALQAYVQAKYNTILNKKIYEFYTGVPVTL